MTALTQIPAELVAGDTWEWTRDVSATYPASTWSAVYYLENAAGTIAIPASASGDLFSVSVAAADTAAYRPGRYRWRLAVTSGAVRKIAESGWTEVEANPAAAGFLDVRSHCRRMLEAVEAALEKRATDDQLDLLSSSLGSRSAARDIGKLVELRSQYQLEVKAEDAKERLAAGLGNPRRVFVRFGRAQ